jgi:hypothetical protein
MAEAVNSAFCQRLSLAASQLLICHRKHLNTEKYKKTGLSGNGLLFKKGSTTDFSFLNTWIALYNTGCCTWGATAGKRSYYYCLFPITFQVQLQFVGCAFFGFCNNEQLTVVPAYFHAKVGG